MFKNCKNLTSVSFPNKLLFVDDEAFYGCTSLSKMTVGEGIRKSEKILLVMKTETLCFVV